jgi:hypothetical protein
MITIIPYLKEKRCRYLQGIKIGLPELNEGGRRFPDTPCGFGHNDGRSNPAIDRKLENPNSLKKKTRPK